MFWAYNSVGIPVKIKQDRVYWKIIKKYSLLNKQLYQKSVMDNTVKFALSYKK